LVDSRYVVTLVAEAKYFLSQLPPRLEWSEIFGDDSAVGLSQNTNVDGVILEIVEPAEYSGKIYTLRDRFPGHQANHTFSIGELYEFRGTRSEVGKFSFPTCPQHVKELSHGEARAKLKQRTEPRIDDLQWLVGRWRCITREWLSSWDVGPLGSACEDALDYFNIYFPYADEHLTLQLTDNPEDRPIAAEFLARHIRSVFPSDPFEERLVPMTEPGPVRISKDRILVGHPFEAVEFRYARREGRYEPLLILESKFMRLEFYKLPAALGDIRESYVEAPIRDYSKDKIAELKMRYEQMVGAQRAKTAGH